MDALIYKLIHNCQLLSTVLKYLKYALSCDRGGGLLPFVAFTGTCCCKGHGFWRLCSDQGVYFYVSLS